PENNRWPLLTAVPPVREYRRRWRYRKALQCSRAPAQYTAPQNRPTPGPRRPQAGEWHCVNWVRARPEIPPWPGFQVHSWWHWSAFAGSLLYGHTSWAWA